MSEMYLRLVVTALLVACAFGQQSIVTVSVSGTIPAAGVNGCEPPLCSTLVPVTLSPSASALLAAAPLKVLSTSVVVTSNTSDFRVLKLYQPAISSAPILVERPFFNTTYFLCETPNDPFPANFSLFALSSPLTQFTVTLRFTSNLLPISNDDDVPSGEGEASSAALTYFFFKVTAAQADAGPIEVRVNSPSSTEAVLFVSAYPTNLPEGRCFTRDQALEAVNEVARITFTTRAGITISNASVPVLDSRVGGTFLIAVTVKSDDNGLATRGVKPFSVVIVASQTWSDQIKAIMWVTFVSLATGIVIYVCQFFFCPFDHTRQTNRRAETWAALFRNWCIGPKVSFSYAWLIVVTIVVMSVGVYQFVYQQWYTMMVTGNHDLCWYNERCFRPLPNWNVPFNNIVSNVVYVVLGLGFNIYIACQEIFRHYKQDHSLFYCVGWAIIAQGVFSGLYHICPSTSMFQFDVLFNISAMTLMMLAIHQNGSGSPANPTGIKSVQFFAFFFCPLVVFLYTGTLVHLGRLSRGGFWACYILWEIAMIASVYFRVYVFDLEKKTNPKKWIQSSQLQELLLQEEAKLERDLEEQEQAMEDEPQDAGAAVAPEGPAPQGQNVPAASASPRSAKSPRSKAGDDDRKLALRVEVTSGRAFRTDSNSEPFSIVKRARITRASAEELELQHRGKAQRMASQSGAVTDETDLSFVIPINHLKFNNIRLGYAANRALYVFCFSPAVIIMSIVVAASEVHVPFSMYILFKVVIVALLYTTMSAAYVSLPCFNAGHIARRKPRNLFNLAFVLVWAFVLMITGAWVNYAKQVTDWTVDPSASRTFNDTCVLLGYFDAHDVWHLLSGPGVIFTLLVVLNVNPPVRALLLVAAQQSHTLRKATLRAQAAQNQQASLDGAHPDAGSLPPASSQEPLTTPDANHNPAYPH